MSVTVGSGADGGVAGRGDGVGVVVIAVSKVSAALEKDIEAVGSLEVVAIAFEIVAAKLVDDNYDYEFGLGVIYVCVCGRGSRQKKQQTEESSGKFTHTARVNGVGRCCETS